MRVDDLDPAALRRLSGLRPDRGKVLSLYLNLDPSEFATQDARSSAVTSLLDEASRRTRENGLEHDDRVALREDVERARELLESGSLARGAASLAVFACGPAGLFEALRLPRPVGSEVVIDDTPWVEPLARLGTRERVCAVLVSRRAGRVLRGTREALEEVADVADDVHGQHDQGGWSQARYERGIEKEVQDHLDRVARRLFAEWRRSAFDRLVVGATQELAPALEQSLHPYVRERLAGRIDVDVERTRPDEVVREVEPLLAERDREREAAALAQLEDRLGAGGRAASGLADVLRAVDERRVEMLLYAEGASAPGVSCPRCGWLGEDPSLRECPADGAPLDRRDNVIEDAIEATVLQSAEPLAVRHGGLTAHRDVAALLRF